MSKFVILFVSVVVLQVASALQCYNCKGTGCDTDSATWQKMTCGSSGVQPFTGHEWACLKLSYKDRSTYKDMVQRKCVQAEMRDGKATFNCPTTDGEPTSCPVCQTDNCNSAQSISFSFIAFSSVILALLVPKFL